MHPPGAAAAVLQKGYQMGGVVGTLLVAPATLLRLSRAGRLPRGGALTAAAGAVGKTVLVTTALAGKPLRGRVQSADACAHIAADGASPNPWSAARHRALLHPSCTSSTVLLQSHPFTLGAARLAKSRRREASCRAPQLPPLLAAGHSSPQSNLHAPSPSHAVQARWARPAWQAWRM